MQVTILVPSAYRGEFSQIDDKPIVMDARPMVGDILTFEDSNLSYEVKYVRIVYSHAGPSPQHGSMHIPDVYVCVEPVPSHIALKFWGEP